MFFFNIFDIKKFARPFYNSKIFPFARVAGRVNSLAVSSECRGRVRAKSLVKEGRPSESKPLTDVTAPAAAGRRRPPPPR
ncbi:hypothetical protein EVAR_85334_1 [Eumeta japonica]|uniref:Uncharacterized protein n=1 Tax=Eumeta variegata TaxID=151549 RepID=A0A4C1WTU9_EUMVA|nr:hypothetical protein EVAR_85334_1 [Eumeta japonica]